MKKTIDKKKKSGCTYCGGSRYVKYKSLGSGHYQVPCFCVWLKEDIVQKERERSKALVELAKEFLKDTKVLGRKEGTGWSLALHFHARFKNALEKYKVKG